MTTYATLHPFEAGLDPVGANHVPLTPVSFLKRAAHAFAHKTAVIDGERRFTYAGHCHVNWARAALSQERCCRFAQSARRVHVSSRQTRNASVRVAR